MKEMSNCSMLRHITFCTFYIQFINGVASMKTEVVVVVVVVEYDEHSRNMKYGFNGDCS